MKENLSALLSYAVSPAMGMAQEIGTTPETLGMKPPMSDFFHLYSTCPVNHSASFGCCFKLLYNVIQVVVCMHNQIRLFIQLVYTDLWICPNPRNQNVDLQYDLDDEGELGFNMRAWAMDSED